MYTFKNLFKKNLLDSCYWCPKAQNTTRGTSNKKVDKWRHALSYSHTTIMMALKSSHIPFITRNHITKWCFYFTHTLPLSLSPFSVFGRVHNRSSKITVCCRLLAFGSGPELESAKFFRLQLLLQLQQKTVDSDDSNYGLNSATLVITTVSETGKAKRDDFCIWPDLYLSWNFLRTWYAFNTSRISNWSSTEILRSTWQK